MNMNIDLVIADPHPIVLDGLVHLFENINGYSVKSCVHDADAALDAVLKFRPNVLVTELIFKNKPGLVLIKEMQTNGVQTHPVVFTGACSREVSQAIDMGVRGLVSKCQPKHVLTQCIQSVCLGTRWLDKDLTLNTVAHLLDKNAIHVSLPDVLTEREMVVAKMASQGLPNKKIAQKLLITEGTAKLHLHHIYQKLNCPGRMALALHMQGHSLG